MWKWTISISWMRDILSLSLHPNISLEMSSKKYLTNLQTIAKDNIDYAI